MVNTNSPSADRSVKGFDLSGLAYMTDQSMGPRRRPPRRLASAPGALLLLLTAACGGHTPQIPNPRPIVNFNGARIRVDKARMDSINQWVNREQDNITNDPTFMVETNMSVDEVYPWEGMQISHDTVRLQFDAEAPDSRLAVEIYGHLHLMAKMGRLAEFLPEAATATGFDLEKAILARVADTWLLARTVYDVAPYAPLDELIYARDAGYLDAFIFTARPDQFAEARAEWARANPGRAEEYRTWFLKTFNREPPGLRTKK